MTDLQKSFSANFADKECTFYTDEPLSNHCAFRIGGASEILAVPKTEKVLSEILKYAKERSIPLHILGNGSNVLIADEGLSGITVKLMGGLCDLLYLGDGIIVSGAGVSLTRLCNFAKEHSLTGLEFAAGIPGTLGGAVTMNAGAYGGEMKDVLTHVEVLCPNGEIKELNAEELNLSYRYSLVPEKEWIVLGARMKLAKGDKIDIKAKMDEYSLARRTKQPLEYPSAGSTFKRPEGYFAGKLIMEAGLRGYQVGGAQVAEKHCGFVINKGNATAADILQLMSDVAEKVEAQFGVKLEPEVKMIGEF